MKNDQHTERITGTQPWRTSRTNPYPFIRFAPPSTDRKASRALMETLSPTGRGVGSGCQGRPAVHGRPREKSLPVKFTAPDLLTAKGWTHTKRNESSISQRYLHSRAWGSFTNSSHDEEATHVPVDR